MIKEGSDTYRGKDGVSLRMLNNYTFTKLQHVRIVNLKNSGMHDICVRILPVFKDTTVLFEGGQKLGVHPHVKK